MHMLGGENFLLYPSWVLVARLIIKFTQDRLTVEKETNFNLCAQRSHRNRKKALYETDKLCSNTFPERD